MFSKITGVYFAIIGFFLASLSSLLGGASLMSALTRGLIVLVVFWILGQIFGWVFINIIQDTIISRKRERERERERERDKDPSNNWKRPFKR